MDKENCEFNEFVTKFINSIQEINDDFNKLSDNNKKRFENFVTNIINAYGINGLINYFSHK